MHRWADRRSLKQMDEGITQVCVSESDMVMVQEGANVACSHVGAPKPVSNARATCEGVPCFYRAWAGADVLRAGGMGVASLGNVDNGNTPFGHRQRRRLIQRAKWWR